MATKLQVLVVDDERPLANALKLKIQKAGVLVDVAYNGRDAMAKMKDCSPDVVLLDLMMPEVDGFAVLENCKSNNCQSKIIVISNLSQDEDMHRVKALGAVEYFVKSNTPIKNIVDYVLKLLHHESTQ
jgi:DNA-binding response OmpR family regulator